MRPSSNLKPTAPTKPMGLTRSCPLIQSVCLRSRVFFRWVLDVVSVQTPCHQKLRHSMNLPWLSPDIFWLCLACRAWYVWYVIWTDPCWWYFHHSDVVVGCLSKVSRGASGACVRRAERVGSPRPLLLTQRSRAWDLEVPVSLTGSLVIPTNKIYSTTVAMKNSAVFMWFLSMSHHNKNSSASWRVDLRFVKFGTRDSLEQSEVQMFTCFEPWM